MVDSQIKTEFPGVAVVTGAASGIGAATARSFAEAGCRHLALIDLNEKGLADTRDSLHAQLGASKTDSSTPHIAYYQCDISDSASVTRTYSQILSDFGRIDYAVNCAGVTTNYQSTTECSLEDFDRITNTNYRGLWLCEREELKAMQSNALPAEEKTSSWSWSSPRRSQRGAIVNIASTLAFISIPSSPAYCAAKAAVVALTRSDALDYSRDRIRINAVCPGLTFTPMTQSNPEVAAFLDASVIPMIPMKRLARPEEIADAAVFLCSTRASYIQGVALEVDGAHIAL